MIFRLTITFLILLQIQCQLCGNGKIEGLEKCDDGNTFRYDGCYNCLIEIGYQCVKQPSICSRICGNGKKDGIEECDDGNYINGDGCSYQCIVEQGWECQQQLSGVDICQLICGDGNLNINEECDDANLVAGDGCNNCQIEFGWDCTGVCTKQCGNGIREQWEECDDGNLIDNDGCSNCQIDLDYQCSEQDEISSSICVKINDLCGDGYKTNLENCEDGNVDDGDGCSSSCKIESGWTCVQGFYPYSLSVCSPQCGDGKILGNEQCDDGNTLNGDGCNSQCQSELSCGDGIRTSSEECDDGNNQNGDGCSSQCLIEIGWTCNPVTGSLLDQCTQCVYQCQSCINQTIYGCTNCYPGFVKFELSQRCEPSCPIGFFQTNQFVCKYCPEGCSKCLSSIPGQCTSCNLGYYFYLGNCQQKCLEGYFSQDNAVYGNVCQKCFKPCTICTGELSCTSCEQKYYLDDKQQCKYCDMGEHCLKCNKGENRCLICEAGYFPHEDGCQIVPNKCGDGMRYFSEECDDGNLKEKDGCSSQCKIEQGWNCVIEINSADFCYKLEPLNFFTIIDRIHFDTLYIQFTRPLNDKFRLYDFSQLISVSIPNVDYFIVHMELEQLNLLGLRFEFNQTLLNQNASIKILQPTVIVDKYNWTLVGNQNDPNISTKTYPTKSALLNYFLYYTSDEYDFAQTLSLIIIFISLGSVIVSLNYTRKFGEGKQWKIIESLQLLSLMRFLNFRYSLHVETFLKYLSIYSLSFIPNIFQLFGETTINISTMRQMPPNFIIQDFSPSFLLNAGGILISLFIYLTTLQGILWFILGVIPYEPLEDLIREILDYFHWQIYIRVFEVMFFEVALSIFINFSYGYIIPGIDLASFVFAILTCLSCLALIGVIVKFVIIPDATSNLWLHQKAQCLYDGFNLRTRIGKIYILVPYLQKVLIVMTLVIVINPFTQVIIILCIRIVIFSPCFKYNPFTNKLLLIRDLLNEIMNVLCYVSALTFLHYYDTKQQKQSSSWIVALLIVINSLTQGILNFTMYFFQNSFKPPDYLLEVHHPDEKQSKPLEYVSKLRHLRVQRKKDVAQEIEDLKILEQQKQLKDEALEQLKEQNLDDFFNEMNVK